MSEWKITDTNDSVTAESPELLLEISKTGPGVVKNMVWKEKLAYLRFLNMHPLLRSGQFYDIYKLNCLFEQLAVEYQDSEASADNGLLRMSVTSAIRDLSLLQEITVDVANASMAFRLSATKNGPGKDRLQFIYVSQYPNMDQGVALIAPTKDKLLYHRAYEPSGQELRDQDHHTFFARTDRLDSNFLLLSSGQDAQCVKYSGENVKYSAFSIWPEDMSLELYGNDFYLEQNETYSESLSLQLIDGLGGLSKDDNDNLNGIGALLQSKYIKTQDSLRVYFSAPNKKIETRAVVLKDDKEYASADGTSHLELDVSSLPDGEYTVNKEMRLDDQRYHGHEELVVLRSRYQEYDAAICEMRRFTVDSRNGKQLDAKTAIRLDLIEYILEEVQVYMAFSDTRQVDGLFKDADRLAKAIREDESAELPERGEIMYQNDFSRDRGDFDFYGNGEVRFSSEMGLYIAPIRTIDAWSQFKTQGPVIIEFDYYVMPGRGGTMLQMCGTHPNPVNDHSLMNTANGNMAYYNFGTFCYHYSFNRGDNARTDRICNLRKTGKGFYVLSKIEDPFYDKVDTWCHLTFVKNNNHLLFFVDNRLVQEYFEQGNRGPVLDEGHIGLRNWSTRKGAFKNMVVSRIKKH
jgi:Domain of unknown function (DUF1961)